MANRRVCTQAKALHGGVKLPDDRDDERRNSPEALRVDFKGLLPAEDSENAGRRKRSHC
jgi:hypothetical protein